jgi:Tol biopolymer transport system component
MNRLIAIATLLFVMVEAQGDRRAVFAQVPTEESQAGLGSKIVFGSTQHIVPEPPPGLDFDLRMQLYIMNGDGSEQRQLTDFIGVKIAAACSPDGQQIAFTGGQTPFNSRPGIPSIFLMDADTLVDRSGNGLTELVSGGNFPTWSPEGKKIAFQGPGPGRDIFVLDLQTLELINLTNDPNDPQDDAWDDYRPDWSPDGRRIAFTSNRGGNPEVYVMNADGSEPVRLTFSNGATSAAPDWSPNGRQIVFQSNRDHPEFPNIENQPGSELYVMNPDGTGLTRLTDNLARDLDPNWSPDGKQIVFDNDGVVALTRQLSVMSADGSYQRPLTGRPGENAQADWCRGHAVAP